VQKMLNFYDISSHMDVIREWYDGYHTASGERLYNPRSVVCALTDNQLSNYWVSSGKYDSVFTYIRYNVDQIQNDLTLMFAGEKIPSGIQEYAATAQELKTKEEIYSAMVVYGLLTYDNGMVFIPNKELMGSYAAMMKKEESLGYVDFIFYPIRHDQDCMILELKVDHKPEEAIAQIKEKEYALRFKGKTAERKEYTGRILAVGISYNSKTKEHECKIEQL